MKTLSACISVIMCIILLCPTCAEASNTSKHAPSYVKGDVNGDLIVDVSDIAVLVSLILSESSYAPNGISADVNDDGHVDISDVASIVELILSDSDKNQGTEDMEVIPGEWE